MKCMCAQTRPQCTLSSKKSFGGMESEPMLTPREKSPLPEAQRIGPMTLHHTGQSDQHTTDRAIPASKPGTQLRPADLPGMVWKHCRWPQGQGDRTP